MRKTCAFALICAYFFLKYYDQFDGTPTGRGSVLLVLVY